MNILTRTIMDELIDIKHQWCVSIYLPTHRTGMDIQQDPIRLKNILKKAEEQLAERGVRLPVAQNILEPAMKLLHDSSFWQHQSEGLAIFLSDKEFYSYCLPLNFEELLVVSDHFYIKSLLPLFTGDGQYYLLALSQNHIRLFYCTHYNINEIDIRQIPDNLIEALQDDENEAHLQSHTSSTAGTTAGRSPVYHGQGGGRENLKNDILRFFNKIDDGLVEFLKGIEAPLVLAGVEFILPIYKEANTYPYLVDSLITGNPDLRTPKELHERSWDIIGPLFRKKQEEAMDRYRQLSGQGSKSVSDTLQEIIPAAFNGQVDTLFVAAGVQQWGSFNRNLNTVQLHEKEESSDEDLMDIAAVFTLLKGGTVYLVKPELIPGGTPVAAVLRF